MIQYVSLGAKKRPQNPVETHILYHFLAKPAPRDPGFGRFYPFTSGILLFLAPLVRWIFLIHLHFCPTEFRNRRAYAAPLASTWLNRRTRTRPRSAVSLVS